MFDNVLTFEQTSEIFCYAVHPYQPILSLGLVTGHVETYKLSKVDQAAGKQQLRGSMPAGKTSLNGYGLVQSAWRTRRHAGSCRALTFSCDGSTLYSAGTDGLLKAACPLSGKVVGKVALPRKGQNSEDHPSAILALSEQTLVLGTDHGTVHIYGLDFVEAKVSSAVETNASKYLIPRSEASTSHRPHLTDEEPNASEHIASITSIPPSSRSTSGASRSFITICGETLAVTDIYKGVTARSIEQEDELMSCLYVGERSNNSSKSETIAGRLAKPNDLVLVGTSSGQLNVWVSGQWQDRQSGSTISNRSKVATTGLPHDPSIECLTKFPPMNILKLIHTKTGYPTVAVGTGEGLVLIIGVEMRGSRASVTVLETLTHDEFGVDGVSAIGFDVDGRMISIGGAKLKIWYPKIEEQSGVIQKTVSNGAKDDSEEDILSEDEDTKRSRKRSRRRRKSASLENSNHRILRLHDLQ